MSIELKDEEIRIATSIRENRERVETAVLSTDERVLARVTDGIYRQPGSALRELISNAYDADATQVIVRTDEPRFNTMSIEDNGNGMSPDVLSYLIHHIGGSAKRNQLGAQRGVTSNDDFNRSPNGRKLIGKIGIGLFSVAQLTQSFQIITKKKSDDFRSIATVSLTQFAENINLTADKKEYKSGVVKLWTEKASDIDTHGTTIILNKIRPQTRETLQSKQMWDGVVSSIQESEENGALPIEPPKYHIGLMADEYNINDLGSKSRSLPWDLHDDPKEAFKKLSRSVLDLKGRTNVQISRDFDYYLKMVWDIALSIPAKYVEKSIYEIPYEDQFYPYEISNSPKGQAIAIDLNTGDTLANYFKKEPSEDDFEVMIDNLQLSRPILFEKLPVSEHALKKPMIFVGNFEASFEGKSTTFTAGPLRFHAYLFWNSKISPVEHQGSLIRINNASGTLFDENFMRYQVQEITRKRQVTCEIFIEEGLDSALNIDRESYNFSHPHIVILTKWLHNAFRQLTNANKALSKKVREATNDSRQVQVKGQIKSIVTKAWADAGNDEYQSPPSVSFENEKSVSITKNSTDYVLNLESRLSPEKNTMPERNQSSFSKGISGINAEKVKAITAILASYGLLDKIPKNKIDQMIYSIYEVIVAED
ncbi:MAG: ATP-binding protein [Pantoea sp. Morm]|uniref:ATP-binding protein n=1 Tax=Pantoea sp. Morm TaxID=2601250 RepID=UPI001DAF8094|nr:ATP-binding protein [Pantoea sp. Morm]